MSKYKVALMTRAREGTGFGSYVYSFYKYLSKIIDVDVFYYDFPGRRLGLKPSKDVKIIKIPSFSKHKKLSRILLSLRKIPKKYIPKGYDIYHFSDVSFWSFFPKINSKIVVTCQDMYPFKKETTEMSFLSKINYKNAIGRFNEVDKVVCVSKTVKKDLKKFTDYDSDFCYIGIDTERFRPKNKIKARGKLNLPLDKFIIFNVGEAKSKNIEMVIRVFAKINRKYPNTLLVRVGQKVNLLTKIIGELNISDKIERRGRIYGEDLVDYYNSADLFVFPSQYEGFGLPPLEAMACGIPTITSKKGTMKETLKGAVVQVKLRECELFNSIEKMINSKELRERWGKRGLERVRKQFTWEKSTEKMKMIYDEMVK